MNDYNYNFPRGRQQALYQFFAMLVTLACAIVGGLITGILMRLALKIDAMAHYDYFHDRAFWAEATDYDYFVIRPVVVGGPGTEMKRAVGDPERGVLVGGAPAPA